MLIASNSLLFQVGKAKAQENRSNAQGHFVINDMIGLKQERKQDSILPTLHLEATWPLQHGGTHLTNGVAENFLSSSLNYICSQPFVSPLLNSFLDQESAMAKLDLCVRLDRPYLMEQV